MLAPCLACSSCLLTDTAVMLGLESSWRAQLRAHHPHARPQGATLAQIALTVIDPSSCKHASHPHPTSSLRPSVAPYFARKGGRSSHELLACKSKRWNTRCHCCQVELGDHACVTPLLILSQNIAPVDWATGVRFALVSRAPLGGGTDPAFFSQVL